MYFDLKTEIIMTTQDLGCVLSEVLATHKHVYENTAYRK